MALLYCWSGAAGTATGADWANAKTTLTAAFTTEVAGDTIFVAHDHAESTAAAITLASSGTVSNITKVICVNRAGSVPPVSADRRATAQVATTGASTPNINFTGFAHYDGIIFVAGNGATNTNIIIPSATPGTSQRFDNCSLRLGSTGSGSKIYIGNSGTIAGSYIELNNTTVSFGHILQLIDIGGVLRWRNTVAATLGTVPTNLFNTNTSRGGAVECIGVDLSAVNTTIVAATAGAEGVAFKFVDCKLNASVIKSQVPASHGSTEVDFVRSGAAGVNYAVYRHRMSGELMEELVIVRTGGAAG